MTLTLRSQKLEHFRCRYCFANLLLLLGLTGYSRLLPAQVSPPAPATITLNTRLVVLPVRITDAHGDFVSGLSEGNFRVYEDGRLQRISLFQQEDTPVSVGLVVDHSRSMAPELAEVASAIVAFAKSSNPHDEMFVVDFSDDVSIEFPSGNPFTDDPAELAKAVLAVSARGQTALYDAVNEGLNHLQLAHGDKKALIIVSDGGDNASRHKYADVLALARRSQTVIYSIGLLGDTSEEENPKVLQRLCDDSGGIAFLPDAGESVTKVSERIARDLREQYTLGFAPDMEHGNYDNRFRKIEVKVAAPGRGKMHVQTRHGYSDSKTPATTGKRAS